MSATATQGALSSQDMDDLRGIAQKLPTGHPMQQKIATLLNSQPTQYEQEHTPQEGAGNAIWNDIKSAGSGLLHATDVFTPIGMVKNAAQTAIDDRARKQEGRSLPYRILAGGAEYTGLMNPRPMEEAANRGDVGAVKGHAVLPTALALSPLVGEGLGRVAGRVGELIPNTERAGRTFTAIKTTAGANPLDVSAPGNTALEIQDLSKRGGQTPKVIRDFIARTTDPAKGPLTYAEARDFYSNASRMSAAENTRLTPALRRQVAKFTGELGSAITDAADQSGMGPQYQGAMNEYRKAMQIKEMKEAAKEHAATGAAKAAGYGLGGAVAGYGVKRLLGQ